MGKMRFGPAKDLSLKNVRSPDAIIQYIDRVIEVPVPVEIVRTERIEVPVERQVPGPERIVEVIKEVEKIVYVDKVVEIPVITKGDEMELKELASQFERHQTYSNQSINKQQMELNKLDKEIKKQKRLFFVYGAISGILTILGFLVTK